MVLALFLSIISHLRILCTDGRNHLCDHHRNFAWHIDDFWGVVFEADGEKFEPSSRLSKWMRWCPRFIVTFNFQLMLARMFTSYLVCGHIPYEPWYDVYIGRWSEPSWLMIVSYPSPLCFVNRCSPSPPRFPFLLWSSTLWQAHRSLIGVCLNFIMSSYTPSKGKPFTATDVFIYTTWNQTGTLSFPCRPLLRDLAQWREIPWGRGRTLVRNIQGSRLQ